MTTIDSSECAPRSDTQLVLLGGLPGSGKTYYAKQLEQQGWYFRDDSQQNAHRDSAQFDQSKHYDELLHT